MPAIQPLFPTKLLDQMYCTLDRSFAGLNFCEQNGIPGFWCVSVHPVDVCMPWVDQVCEYIPRESI